MTQKKVKGKFREELCSACPYVQVWSDGAWEERGEILRNIRSRDLEATHHLPLGRRSGEVRVRLVERKPETTYVDEVALVAHYDDGTSEVLSPSECATTSMAMCEADGMRQSIPLGAREEVSFQLPRPARVELRARGYYIPMATDLD